MPQNLIDCVVKSIVILETSPIGKQFDKETLEFFQQLYLWRRPEKFLHDGNEAKIIAGAVGLWKRHTKVLQFQFDNGYVWKASIVKLTDRRTFKRCKAEALTRAHKAFKVQAFAVNIEMASIETC